MKIKKILLFIVLCLSMFLISCTSIPPEKQCTEDKDCVPASCCHPIDAVNKENSPNCEGVKCTLECASGTMDCGQGETRCVSGQCQAVIFK
jgi:hypothetical protein